MRFVYATRPLPALEFGTANLLEAVPPDAEVVAVCDGAMTIRREHHQALSTLTEQEQIALEELIVESQISEARMHASVKTGYGFFGRLLRRLLNI